MNTVAFNQNLVHESESQRQYARVKLPATLIIEDHGKISRYTLTDLSAGGFAFYADKPFAMRKDGVAKIEFNIDGFLFSMPVSFDVKTSEKDGRLGCMFQGMSAREISSLRHMITAYLSGELVNAGDMVNILTRDNFAKSRGKKGNEGLSPYARMKALGGSLVVFLIGVLAFAFVVTQLWSILFFAQSKAGVVQGDSNLVSMPREGVVKFLVEQGESVKAGQVIGVFEAPLISFMGSQIGESQMNSDSVKAITDNSYRGSLVSPCDCVVSNFLATSGEYLEKSAPLINLVSETSRPFIQADFSSKYMSSLALGKTVQIEVGQDVYEGKLSRVFVQKTQTGQLPEAVSVQVELAQNFPESAIGSPASVNVAKLDWLNRF